MRARDTGPGAAWRSELTRELLLVFIELVAVPIGPDEDTVLGVTCCWVLVAGFEVGWGAVREGAPDQFPMMTNISYAYKVGSQALK